MSRSEKGIISHAVDKAADAGDRIKDVYRAATGGPEDQIRYVAKGYIDQAADKAKELHADADRIMDDIKRSGEQTKTERQQERVGQQIKDAINPIEDF
ncbi:unnamed protein product [Caenorhabditis auriculariae]|uniref:Antitoxin n=1 Tax=Caenorhabditis auriculariae TaxID=2777116 RepID=A0A8S1HTA2_9PELO|nr:unnamed protein product [Caenorhabditis auriculariae]